MMNKRGQETSPIGAIVAVILAVVVLVALILGFTLGWDKILPWLPKDNIQTIVTQCQVACSTSNQYDYCTATRTLKAPTLPDVDKGQKTATCKAFETVVDKGGNSFGFAPCPAISSSC